MVKRILSMLVMLLLIGCLTLTALPAHPAPELSQPGSSTFVMDLDGGLVGGGDRNVCRNGDICEEDGD